MKLFVGVTDAKWYNYLRARGPDEVNFWQPNGKTHFWAVEPGALFLFKLHSPDNYIAGGGLFVSHALLPLSLAWDAFGDKNDVADYPAFSSAIHRYRRTTRQEEPDPTIGCIILASPFFLPRADWIPIPEDWAPNIVQGKTYDTDTLVGQRLYSDVCDRLVDETAASADLDPPISAEEKARFGQPHLKTIPVLEAAHIRPYSQDGPHQTANGVLLRRDLHSLFDRGYITITPDLELAVSSRIHTEFGNGREYYGMDGRRLVVMPD